MRSDTGNDRAGQARRELADIGPRLAELVCMTVGELREEFLQIYGFPTNSRNRDHLRKRVAWKIQAEAEGGLSQRALARIEELAPLAPVRWRPRLKDVKLPDATVRPAKQGSGTDGKGPGALGAPDAGSSRDERLPPPGTIISRDYRDRQYKVRILQDGFEYDGGFYDSLSRVARAITSTNWNGYLFFRHALELARQGKE